MEEKESLIESLIERTEEYAKTNIELLKLKCVDKTSNTLSSLVSLLYLKLILVIFIITLSIGSALWLGDLLGKNYYGFMIISGFYAVVGILLMIIQPFIKERVKNSIINHLLN